MRVLSLCLLGLACLGQTRDEKIARAAQALKPKLVEMRRDFAMNPELSNQEQRTAKVVVERLRALGLEDIRTGIAKHGITALLKGGKPGPVVAWRADMDGLPIDDGVTAPYKSRNKGVKHACGHDGHVATALGLAEVLIGMRNEIAGTIKFIFQPAEEGAPDAAEFGAALMVKEGVLENPRPKAIFALHVWSGIEAGHLGYSSGAALASADRFIARIIGKKSHGAQPHLGTDAVTIAAECVLSLQSIRSRQIDPLQPMVLSIGAIHGGNRSNIIAEEVTLEGTVRTLREDIREGVRTMMRQTLNGCTAAHGAKAEISWEGTSYPVTYNEPALAEWSGKVLKRVLGDSKALLVPPTMGAEDFSYFQKVIPGFMYFVGVGNQKRGITAGHHTADFDLDEDGLVVGLKTAAALLLDYMETK